MLLGIDLGGTNIKAGICDARGRVLASDSIPTEAHRGPADTLRRMAELGRRLAGRRRIGACGVGVPGPLDLARTRIYVAPNLEGWKDVRVPAVLRRLLGVPVVMENDANCAAVGESRAWPPCDGFALYTLGTGVGGGIVLNGELWVGASGAAGELGHMTVDPHGPRCGCGRCGCLEAFASATAVARAAGRPAHEAFRSRDPKSRAAVARAAWALGAGIANLIHVFHPDLVVLAGGMARAGRAILDPVRAEVRRRVFAVQLAKIRIELSRLGDDAGWTGAALWAARKHRPH
ncbi:MAG: ROK family protein [Planctomycetes bacterium]|nr:ROK family protein [Planctomycetota bacterium]